MDEVTTDLTHFGIDEQTLTRALGEVLGKKVDDADIFLEHMEGEAISLEEGMVKKASRSIHQGVGIRAVADDRTGYAHSDEIDGDRMLEAARAARSIASDPQAARSVAIQSPARGHDLYPSLSPTVDIPLSEKLSLLEQIDIRARGYDTRIKQVFASISSEMRTIAIIDRTGMIRTDKRPLCRLNVTCIAQEGNNRQTGSAGGGGRMDYAFFLNENRWQGYVDEAARRALLLLSAVDAPAGSMDVVLAPGWPGILLHEAIGHGLEGDFNRKGTSAFSGLLNQQVASPLVTVVDDGTLAQQRGSLNFDDEGTSTQRNVLIENGVLRGYMQDKLNARLMGVEPTGNGRRQSYAHAPMPRMTNTFMLAGDDSPEDIIKGVKRGIYAVAFGGGQVDITSGKFTFSGSEAYLIEDGQITAPVKGATFIGNGPDVLRRVTAVGHDMELDPGIGTCGKDGQSVPVCVGLPTIRINDLTVGGIAV